MISNSIKFDEYELKSVELALYFRKKWSDAQCGRKDLKEKKTFRIKFGAREEAETYLHGTTLPEFTIIPSL